MADPTLYLYTSLTAGSSHIITATSRMETILKANKLPFRAIDCATDEKARQLWGRRSKGKKLPGLVKYGQVIADLEQVEEWNEFGELVDQVEDISDIFGDTPMTDTPLPPPVNTLPPNPLKPIIETPAGMAPQISRSSSETRHISIAEPTEKKDKSETVVPLAPKGVVGQTPLAMALRQAGVEAAAKAGQKKAAATSAARAKSAESSSKEGKAEEDASPAQEATIAAVPVTKKPDSSDTTPNPALTKASPDAILDSTSAEEKRSITAAKTPTQLEAEGVRRASGEKTSPETEAAAAADTSDVPPIAADPAIETKSTEEQVLDRRRTSSIAKTKSSLSKETSIDEIPSDDEENNGTIREMPEKSLEEQAAAQAVANVEREKAEEKAVEKAKAKALVTDDSIPEGVAVSSSTVPPSSMESTDDISSGSAMATIVPNAQRTHRGSSLSEVPDEEIREIEKKNAILEESEEDEDEDDVKSTTPAKASDLKDTKAGTQEDNDSDDDDNAPTTPAKATEAKSTKEAAPEKKNPDNVDDKPASPAKASESNITKDVVTEEKDSDNDKAAPATTTKASEPKNAELLQEKKDSVEEEDDDDKEEEDEDDEDESEDEVDEGKTIAATDKQEAKVVKDSSPQETKAAEPTEADKSVGD